MKMKNCRAPLPREFNTEISKLSLFLHNITLLIAVGISRPRPRRRPLTVDFKSWWTANPEFGARNMTLSGLWSR